jgi:hypothetical protein
MLNAEDCPIPRPPEIPYKELVGLDGDCGSAFLPASAVDLDLVALHCARLTLSVLQGETLSYNYLLIRGRSFLESEYPELKGDMRAPFRLHQYDVPRNFECHMCLQ